MKTTALKDIQVEEVTYKKDDNRINVQFCDGAYSISTTNWEFKSFDEFIALFDCFKGKVTQTVEEPPKVEEPKAEPEAKPKKERTDQFRPRWTDEQKQRIAKRYQSGEGPSSTAKDYNVTPNTIHQICIRMGVKRGKPAKKTVVKPATKPILTPAEEEKQDKERKRTLKEYREQNPKPWYLQTDKK